jgi:hypothetical protein
MRGPAAIAVVLAAATLPCAAARADVLVSRPQPAIRCGGAITAGVWYRDFPTEGARRATISVLSASGAVLWRKRVTATDRWRYFRYHPSCGRRYRLRYVTDAGTTTFAVSVRSP